MKNGKQDDQKANKFQEEFKNLPLEEKVKALLRMEAVTLQETFNYGLNESIKAADRLGLVLSEFGKKIEAEFKKATQNTSNKAKSDTSKKPPPKQPKTEQTV